MFNPLRSAIVTYDLLSQPSSPTNQSVKDSTRAMREKRDNKVAGKRDASPLSLDLNTSKCRRVESDFDGRLADSIRAWD